MQTTNWLPVASSSGSYKALPLVITLFGLSLLGSPAQNYPANSASGVVRVSSDSPDAGSPAAELRTNQIRRGRVQWESGPSGVRVARDRGFVELSAGVRSQGRPDNRREAADRVVPLAQGGAAALGGERQVYFPEDIYQGVIDLALPGRADLRLRNRPLGLFYACQSNTVLFGELTNSTGQILPSGNQVIYTNAFFGVDADLICTCTPNGGYESEVVFRRQPAPPADLGSADVRLQLLTEFFDTPEPVQEVGPVSKEGLRDTTLSFDGKMRMIPGKAFLAQAQPAGGGTPGMSGGTPLPPAQPRTGGTPSELAGGDARATGEGERRDDLGQVPVFKSWIHSGNRVFLVEELPWGSILPNLQTLPPPPARALTATPSVSPLGKVSSIRLLPPPRMAQKSSRPMQMAAADWQQTPGVDLDYVLVNSQETPITSPDAPMVFQGGVTYLIDDPVVIGDVVLQPGATIKFARGASLTVGNSLTCLASAAAPVTLTALDDDSQGEIIPGSTGQPSGVYAQIAIASDQAPLNVGNVRILYAGVGVQSAQGPVSVRDSQFIQVGAALAGGASGGIEAENVLFEHVGTAFAGQDGVVAGAAQITVYDVDTLAGPGVSLAAINSLFICVTNWGAPWAGFNNVTNSTDAGGLQASGGGADIGYHGPVLVPSAAASPLSSNLPLTPTLSPSDGEREKAALASSGLLSPECVPPPSGLVAWWRAESNVLDSVGTNSGAFFINGTPTNGIYTNGVVGQAFSLDGTNYDVEIPDAPALRPTNFTIDCWVQFASLNSTLIGRAATNVGNGGDPGEQYIISKKNPYPGECWDAIALEKCRRNSNGDFFEFTVVGLGSNGCAIDSAPGIQAGQWYYLACVRGSNYMQLYTNGLLAVQNTNVSSVPYYDSEPLRFGRCNEPSYDGYLNGNLDEVSLYNRALSADEILSIYNAGSAGKCPSNQPPSFTLSPTNLALCPGSATNFITTNVSGTPPYSYQWSFNGTNLVGATNTSLSLSSVSSTNAGIYTVIVANAAGSATNSALLTVWTNIAITSQPASLTNCPGTPANFSVTASGSGVSYQWYYNLTNVLTNQTGATLTLSNVSNANAGSYGVVVSGTCGVPVTNSATLTVESSVTITSLTPQTTCPGSNVIFSTTASGTGPFYYSWSWNTNPIGQNTNVLVLTNVCVTNQGLYCVTVSGACSNATSCAYLTVLTNTTVAPLGNQIVPAGSNAVFNAVASGSGLSYVWKRNGFPLAGQFSNQLVLTNVSWTNAGFYTVEVTGACGSATNWGWLNVLAPSQVIVWGDNTDGQTNVPAGLTNVVAIAGGQFHCLALTANGRVVAWGLNNCGQTNIPAGLSNVVAIAAGDEHCLALTGGGQLAAWGYGSLGQTNIPAGLTNAVAVAAGGFHNLALTGGGQVVAWGFNVYGQTNVPAGLTNAVAVAAGMYHSLALMGNGQVAAWGYGSLGQTNVPPGLSNVVAIAAGGNTSLALTRSGQLVAWGDDTYGETNIPAGLSNVVAIAVGGYHCLAITSSGRVAAWGENNFGQTNVPPGLTNVVAIAGGMYDSLAVGGLAPVVTVQPTNQVICPGSAVTFSVLATGTPPLSYQWQFNNAAIPGATNSSWTVTNAQTNLTGAYSVMVSNSLGWAVSSNAALYVLMPPFVALLAPTNGAVFLQGTNVTLTAQGIETNGSVMLMQFYTGSYLLGATNGNGSQSNLFTVVLTNVGGAMPVGTGTLTPGSNILTAAGSQWCGYRTVSASVAVRLIAPPSESLISPTNAAIFRYGTSIPLTAQVTQPDGATVTNVQFLLNGSTLIGAVTNGSNNLFTFGWSGAPAGTDTITVAAFDTDGLSWTNGPSSIFVLTPPSITQQPTPANGTPGQSASFSVVASGSPPLSYQWQFNGTNIPGATNTSYTINPVQAANAGNYSVVVSNPVGSVTSAAAALTVSCLPLASGLLAWWQGEGNGDDSVSTNNLYLGDVTFSPGEIGQAFTFCSGWYDYAQSPALPGLGPTNGGGFTIECWINPYDSFTPGTLAEWDDDPWGDPVATLSVNFSGTGTLDAGFFDRNMNSYSNSSAPNLVSPGVFQHVAFSYDWSSRSAAFYYNGTLVTNWLMTNTLYTPSVLTLGVNWWYYGLYKGLMDEVGVYDRALSAQEIQAIYDAAYIGHCPIAPTFILQPTSQTDFFGEDVRLNSQATGTQPLGYQWFLNGNPITNATNQNLWLTNLQAANTGTYYVQASNRVEVVTTSNALVVVTNLYPPVVWLTSPTNNPVFSSGAVITNTAEAYSPDGEVVCVQFFSGTNLLGTANGTFGSCVGWWRGQFNANDSIGTNNGIATAMSYAPGVCREGFDFNGGTVLVPDNPAFYLTNSLTVEGWFYANALTGKILERGDNRGGHDPIAVDLYGDNNQLSFRVTDTNGSWAGVEAPVGTNTWVHFAATLDGSSGDMRLYTNGVLAAQTNTSIRPIGALIAQDTPVVGIGCNNLGFLYYGLIDEIALFSRALSPAEVQNIYSGSTTNSFTFVWSNAPVGTNSIYAVATDNYGLTNISQTSTITVGNAGPNVQIVSPVNQTLLARTNTVVQATVSNGQGASNTWVQFFVSANGGVSTSLGLALAPTNGLYQVPWTPILKGTYVLTAAVTNSLGLSAWSAPVTNNVRGLPTVAITSPVNGAILNPAPLNITNTATASADGTSIASVSYYNGTNLIGSAATAPYTFVWTNVGEGTYTLRAVATDSLGATGNSAPITITNDVQNAPPVVIPGPNQTNRLPNAVTLTAAVFDDGLPRGNSLTIAWSNVNGPGTVTFDTADQATTTAHFSAVGVYTNQIQVSDGQYTVTSNVLVTMLITNLPPGVGAGPEQVLVWPVTNPAAFINPAPFATNGYVYGTSSTFSFDYFAPSNDLVLLDTTSDGTNWTSHFDVLPSLGGVQSLLYPYSRGDYFNGGDVPFVTVRDSSGGFTPGEVLIDGSDYTGVGYNTNVEIWRILPNGTTVGTNGTSGHAWATLPLGGGSLRQPAVFALCVDVPGGAFGGDLIVITSNSSDNNGSNWLWRINSAGQATLITDSVGVPGVSGPPMITMPDDRGKYGPLAGRILLQVYSANLGAIEAVDKYGFSAIHVLPLQANGVGLISPSEDLFDFFVDSGTGSGTFYRTPALQLEAAGGDILLSYSDRLNYRRARWNGRVFEVVPIGRYGDTGSYNAELFWYATAPGAQGAPGAIPNYVQLQGCVTNNSSITTQLTTRWTMVSGPAAVLFDDATLTNTVARFAASGTYLLRLTATDGELTNSSDVTIQILESQNVTNQVVLMPVYSARLTNTSQTLTATVLDASNNPVAGVNVQFSVAGMHPSTNSATTDAHGRAVVTNQAATSGRDVVQASATVNGQPASSSSIIVDWTMLLNCGANYTGSITTSPVADNLVIAGEGLYANYFSFSGQQLQQIGLTCSSAVDNGLVVLLRNSSNQVVGADAVSPDNGSGFVGEVLYTLPYTGNYVVEIAATNTNVGAGLPFSLSFSCGTVTNFEGVPFGSPLAVLMNGTNVTNGGALVFGPTLTNVSVTNTLTLSNMGTANIYFSAPSVTQEFVAACVPPLPTDPGGNSYLTGGGTATLQIAFLASSNEVLHGGFALENSSENVWDKGGSTSYGQSFVLDLVASAFPPGGPPDVQLTAPLNNTTFVAPANIGLAATTNGSTNVAYVSFSAASATQTFALGSVTNPPYAVSWPSVPAGDYALTAAAVDALGRVSTSLPVTVHVISPYQTSPPKAVDDYVTVLMNSSNNVFYVLTNDIDLASNSLTIVGISPPTATNNATPPQSATVSILGGQAISYTPPYFTRGGDSFGYEISDGMGGFSSATVHVTIYGNGDPQVAITYPTNSYTVGAGTGIPITAQVSNWQQVAKVDFYRGTELIGEVTNGGSGNYVLSWTASYRSSTSEFTAVAADNFGQVFTSTPIQIQVTNVLGVGAPVVSILSYTNTFGSRPFTNGVTVREGVFALFGQAYDASNGSVFWSLGVFDAAGDSVHPLISTNIPVGSATSSNVLALCDLTGLNNGAYTMQLSMVGGSAYAETNIQFILETTLKIGQFSFSQQDSAIPVNGVPLTIVRTYNSLNPIEGDFGYGWTWTLGDMQAQIDEVREDVTDLDGNTFSERVSGGSRDVSLTLPNGQRTTFYYSLSGGGTLPQYFATWTAAQGVTAQLTTPDDNTLQDEMAWGDGQPYWQAGDPSLPMDSFDFSVFTLTTLDKTQYIIRRDDLGVHYMGDGGLGYQVHAWGDPYLAQIKEPSGDTITIDPVSGTIVHADAQANVTRRIVFQRNSDGLISSISDPNALTNGGPPAVQYQYDANDNLVNVLQLVDGSGSGTYVTNSYTYTNTAFPHYVTGIVNADGTQVAKNLYDDSGKLIAVQDADGNLTQFIHNLSNNVDVVIDRLNHTNSYVYDLRGNVIAQTNALNGITLSAYDANNNKTNQIQFLNGQPYATNSWVYDPNNLLLTNTDALGNQSTYTYNGYGQVLTSTDARTNTSFNYYDSSGNLLGTCDAMHNCTTNFYSPSGLLAAARDAIGTWTTNSYDGSDNLTGSGVFDAFGNILSTNSFSYDANGNQLTSTVWRRTNGVWTGATTTSVYDGQNRVIQTVNPDGGTSTIVYNAIGKQAQTIDALNHTNSYFYDDQGRLIQTLYPDTFSEYSSYDANGNRTSSTDKLGRVAYYFYDALNRLTNTLYADDTSTSTVYDDLGRVQFGIDARGVTNAPGYDVAGRRVAMTNAYGVANVQTVSFYGYDANGNQTTLTDARNNTTTNVFDALNRTVEVDYPDGTKTFTGYDAAGRRVAETNQDTNVTWFAYDGAGRLTAVTNALTNVTTYAYDEAGNQTNQVDALTRTTQFAYDGMGRRIQRTLPGQQVETMGYDLDGNLLYATNFNGVVMTNRYDVMNRLTNRSSAGGYQVSFTYSPTGQRLSMTDSSGTTTYGYDTRDRLLGKTSAWAGGLLAIGLGYAYDANGNVSNIWSSTPGGVNLQYSYDPLNRITNVLAGGSLAASYGFDANGNLQSLRYANGATNLYQYDQLNRLTNAVWASHGSNVASFYYQLGRTGNRTNLTEAVAGTARTYSWQYDPLYRLTNENISALGTLGYNYDSVGNRTNRASTSGLNGVLPAGPSSFNTNDWLATDAYDKNGNTLQTTNNGIASGLYAYDAENRLTNFEGSVSVSYNGDGVRVKKISPSTTTYYLVDDRNPTGYAQVLEEWTSSGGSPSLSRVYTYGLALVREDQGGAVYYFGTDGHGSTRFLLDGNGGVANSFAYDAYGTLIASNGAAQTTRLYCGEEFDPDLGMYYLRARYYKPDTGRFLTMDSYEGSQSDPLSLHKYLYCNADPANLRDPGGHDGTLGELLVSTFIDTTLASMVSVGVNYAAQHVGYSLLPSWVQQAMKTTVTMDAVEVGLSVGGSVPVGKYPIAVGGGGGLELLVSPRTKGAALYGYAGIGVSFGAGQTKSAAGSLSFGLVFNTPASQNYRGPFYTESIPYKAFPPAIKSKIDAFLASGFGFAFTDNTSEVIEEAKSIGMLVSGALEGRGTANVFFDPCGGGSWGVSFSYALGPSGEASSGPPSISMSVYRQLVPKGNKEVKFR
jgi:RHS repeat-associated protein